MINIKLREDSRGMFEKMLGGVFEKISGKVAKDSGEFWRRFREMLLKILGNIQEDSRECSTSRTFRGMTSASN